MKSGAAENLSREAEASSAPHRLGNLGCTAHPLCVALFLTEENQDKTYFFELLGEQHETIHGPQGVQFHVCSQNKH